MSEPRPPGRRAKVLTAILVPVALFGLLEIGLRVGGYRFEPWEAYAKRYDQWAETQLYRPDPDLLWTLRPSQTLDIEEAGFVDVRTNAAGLRGPDLPGPREPGEIRVLCLGDSITFGLGLREEETWPSRAARALEKSPELTGRRVRVVNGGIPGWSSVQGMRLRDRLSDLRPDVVVFWFGMNDAKRARGFPDREQRIPGQRQAKTLGILRASRVFQLVQGAVAGSRRALVDATRVAPGEFGTAVVRLLESRDEGGPDVIFVRTPERIAVTLAQLEAIAARAREAGVDLLIAPRRLLSPMAPAPPGCDLVGRRLDGPEGSAIVFDADEATDSVALADVDASVAELRAWLASLDRIRSRLPFESLLAEDLFGDAPAHVVFGDNCHLTPEGARLAGEALAREILRRLPSR